MTATDGKRANEPGTTETERVKQQAASDATPGQRVNQRQRETRLDSRRPVPNPATARVLAACPIVWLLNGSGGHPRSDRICADLQRSRSPDWQS